MVLPTRIADPYLDTGRKLAQKIGTDLEPPSTTQRLHRHTATERDNFTVCTEQHRLHGLVVDVNPVDGQVAAGRRSLRDFMLGALHAVQQRYLAVVVAVDAHAKVHLVDISVGVEGFRNPEDGIARRKLDRRKERAGQWCIHGGLPRREEVTYCTAGVRDLERAL